MKLARIFGIFDGQHFWVGSFFALICATAVLGARSDVGGWNDATRLATVESLVDFHTLAIDQSQFAAQTNDKVFVDGYFYSDKPPVPALWQALLYALLQWAFGLRAANQPDLFCFAMTVGSSGLAYVLAVLSIYCIGRRVELSIPQCLLLAGSFAFATLAVVYSRQVNSHILQLAAVGWLMFGLISVGAPPGGMPMSVGQAIGMGMLAGLTYTIDLGAGPVLVLGALGYLAWKGGALNTVLIFALAAFPFFALHHALNFAIGHTFAPVNTVPEYFRWDGCPFRDGGMTGSWMHKHLGTCLRYGMGLLIGERGFLSHQPVVLLAALYFGRLLVRRVPEYPQLGLAGFWCVGTWALYTVGSNNYAGWCCSIRWFLPLLAPAFYALALTLRYSPRFWVDLAAISLGGMFLAASAWWNGPWVPVGPWVLIAAQAGSLVSWIAIRCWSKFGSAPEA